MQLKSFGTNTDFGPPASVKMFFLPKIYLLRPDTIFVYGLLRRLRVAGIFEKLFVYTHKYRQAQTYVSGMEYI